MEVYCVFSLESLLMCTHNITFYNRQKITQNYSKSAAMRFFVPGTQERVRNSRGKRAISVLATEVLLYIASLRNTDTQATLSIALLPALIA